MDHLEFAILHLVQAGLHALAVDPDGQHDLMSWHDGTGVANARSVPLTEGVSWWMATPCLSSWAAHIDRCRCPDDPSGFGTYG